MVQMLCYTDKIRSKSIKEFIFKRLQFVYINSFTINYSKQQAVIVFNDNELLTLLVFVTIE